MLFLLDLSAAFDTINHNIHITRGAALNWFKSYLSNRFPFVHVNNLSSALTSLLWCSAGFWITTNYVLCIYVYARFFWVISTGSMTNLRKQNSSWSYRLVKETLRCRWPVISCLWIQTKQTFFFFYYKTSKIHYLNIQLVCMVLFCPQVLLGETLESFLSRIYLFNSHVKRVFRAAFFHLQHITRIRIILSHSGAEKPVGSFLTSRLDQCSTILAGYPK